MVYWENPDHPIDRLAPQQVIDGGGARLSAVYVPIGGVSAPVDYVRIPGRTAAMVRGRSASIVELSTNEGHGRSLRHVIWSQEFDGGTLWWEFDSNPASMGESETLSFIEGLQKANPRETG
jgi:hypothetical protein